MVKNKNLFNIFDIGIYFINYHMDISKTRVVQYIVYNEMRLFSETSYTSIYTFEIGIKNKL